MKEARARFASTLQSRLDDQTRWRLIWSGFVLGMATAEWWALQRSAHEHAPATAYIRWAFAVNHDHPHIRTTGHALYIGGSLWLYRHLFKRK